MGEESVILTRDRQGKLHVFLNSCRHRGMKLCRFDEGNTRVFSCPVHWAEEPLSRTTRLVTNVRIINASPSCSAADDVEVSCRFLINRNRTTETDEILIGKRVDRLRRSAEDWSICQRTVFINQTVLRANSLSFFI